MSSSSDPNIGTCNEVKTEAVACLPEAIAIEAIKPEGISKKQWKRQLKQKKFEESKPAWR